MSDEMADDYNAQTLRSRSTTDQHSCHDGCQRPACVLGRRVRKLKAERERLVLRKALREAYHEGHFDGRTAGIDASAEQDWKNSDARTRQALRGEGETK